MSLLVFLLGCMGYLLPLRAGLLLLGALPEVSVPVLLSACSQSQYTTSVKPFRDLLASFPALSQKRKRCSLSSQHPAVFLLILTSICSWDTRGKSNYVNIAQKKKKMQFNWFN